MGDGEVMERIFHPEGVAVVGASRERKKPGHLLLYSLVQMGFPERGAVYPINPRAESILGLKTYKSLRDVDGRVDLAIIATPPETVPQVVEGCVEKGVAACVILSAGFGESGEAGKRLEEEVLKIARRGGVRIIGPNCMGVYCSAGRLGFFPDQRAGDDVRRSEGRLLNGDKVSFISESGSIACMFYRMCRSLNVGVNKIVSSGNECDLNATDFLQYLGEDPTTEVIAAYLEGVKDGSRFLKLAREITSTRRKPIIVWMAGITPQGRRAAASHTGALSTKEGVWNAVCKQAGIFHVNNIEELMDMVTAFYFLEPPRGRNVAIVSSPGGPAVSAADACSRHGLRLAGLGEETRREISRRIPRFGTSVENPVDLGFGAVEDGTYEAALSALMDDENVDAVIAIGGAPTFVGKSFLKVEEFAEEAAAVWRARRGEGKPLLAVLPPHISSERPFEILRGAGVPVYPTPDRAARCLSALCSFAGVSREAAKA
ncbi:MAG: acetate--CoA ligase family protein [Candidatus Alkanophagales archaeon]